MITESCYALIYFLLEFNCHIRYEITCYCRRWQSCTLNLSYHAKILGRNLDPKQTRTIRSSKAAIVTCEDIQKPPTKPCMPWQCKAICSEYPRGILFWDLACVCACDARCNEDPVWLYGLYGQSRLSTFRLFCVAVAAASTGFAMCFPRED
jgi:hypothetical protein